MHSVEWGPFYWYILHAITFSYDQTNEQNKKDFRDIIRAIGAVLPCGVCRTHFRQQRNRIPITYDNYTAITKWLFKRHQHVNNFLRKSVRPSYAKAEQMYLNRFNIQKVKRFFHYFIISLNRERYPVYKKVFKLFATTWPRKDKRELIQKLVSNHKYKLATKASLLRIWIKNIFIPHIINDKPYVEPEPTPPTDPSTEQETKHVTFDTPLPTDDEIANMKKQLSNKQKTKINIRRQLLRTRHIPTAIRLSRRLNRVKLKIRNLKSKLSAL